MVTYVILCQVSPEAFEDVKDFKQLAANVSEKIKSECPGVAWKGSFATMGRFDVVDIVESDDPEQVEKAAMIIRAYGHSTTETLVATPWKEFLAMLQSSITLIRDGHCDIFNYSTIRQSLPVYKTNPTTGVFVGG